MNGEIMPEMNLGGHLSLGRNPEATVQEAAEAGFTSMQIFASSPGAWKPPVMDAARYERFARARQEYGLKPLFIHAIYLINLGSANPDLVRRSISSLKATLAAGAELGAAGVITHIGSHAGRGFEAVADQIAWALIEVLEDTPPGIRLLLENAAGAGGIIGADLAELSTLIDGAGRPPQLGVALDTAHLTGSGWDFLEAETPRRLADEVDRLIGRERVAVIHANDSAAAVGSRRDRHANIGEGFIGIEGFRNLLSEPRLCAVPWIMETPDLGSREPGNATGSLTRLWELMHEACSRGALHAG